MPAPTRFPARLTSTLAAAAIAAIALSGCAPEPEAPVDPTPASETSTPPATSPAAPEPTPDPASEVRADLQGLSTAELNTRLIAAAWADDVAEATDLITAGADVNAQDETVQSAYLIATSEGYDDLLALTLAHGADLASLDSYHGTGLIRAAERGHTTVVGTLIQQGISIDHINNYGYVALHEALIYAKPDQVQQYQDTARVLIAAGADLSIATGNTSQTPSMLAEQYGLGRQASLIARAIHSPIPGADAQATLFRAASTGDPDLTALALRAGAAISTPDTNGQTALALATANNHPVTITLLTALGAQ
ncbi:ankyrin repeat domain-containing protein [Leucobacter japonicus]|uniref:ankyrin repeat domain-containing protein n=1 Tax=Leucobacter japonicus TaxID=1461259 RepID=UPI0006A77127|nr:ankyrin repeat domain-containing protein [Leucobacter japonicus]